MKIKGRVINAKTGKPLASAGVFLHNGEIKTNEKGDFVLTLNENLGLGVIKEGYLTETCDVKFENNKIVISISPER